MKKSVRIWWNALKKCVAKETPQQPTTSNEAMKRFNTFTLALFNFIVKRVNIKRWNASSIKRPLCWRVERKKKFVEKTEKNARRAYTFNYPNKIKYVLTAQVLSTRHRIQENLFALLYINFCILFQSFSLFS